MVVAGLQKTSLVDYPGQIASTVFVGGCNFQCPYCHNKTLLNNGRPHISMDDVLSHLNERKHFTDSVVVTGGEPTLYEKLPDVLALMKSYGLRVKLDTNGSRPEMLSLLLAHNLLDYIAMDIKAPLHKYNAVCGTSVDEAALRESIHIIKTTKHYEFRTTVIPDIHTEEDIHDIIASLLNGDAKKYALQRYKPQPDFLQKGWTAADWRKFCDAFSEYSFITSR